MKIESMGKLVAGEVDDEGRRLMSWEENRKRWRELKKKKSNKIEALHV